jgi:ribosomal protein L40E
MSDRGHESVVVHGGERVAARDYVEVHDYHENHTTHITGSHVVVAQPPRVPPAATGPEIGECQKCHHPLWIHAIECRHCGYDPRIEAARQQNEAQAFMAVMFLGWIVASALLYQVAEMVGIPVEARMGFSMIGGAVAVLGILMLRMWPPR